jgi:protein O-GlcNAc transferase
MIRANRTLTIQEAFNLAVQRHRAGNWAQAEELYRQVLAQQPDHAGALHLLGVLASEVGRQEVAIDLIGRAIVLSPNNAVFYFNLSLAYARRGGLDQAMIACRRAVQLDPDFVEAWNNLGNALSADSQPDQAIAAFRQAVTRRPDYATAINNLGNALTAIAKLDEAIACYDRALALKPEDARAGSNRLYALYFHADYDATAILREHQLWDRRYAQPLRDSRPHDNDRSPDRRLRIGYVSPNLKLHSQAPFVVPLLTHHDRDQVEVFCYTDLTFPDAITERLRARADAWKPTAGMSDQAVADLIRGDRIDILMDLTMHMAGGRPLLVARKPAPVQVAWLAYPGTTGMKAMDYRLTDDRLDPPGATDGDYVERSIRLPDTFACFDPGVLEGDLDCAEPPALKNGYVTFGSLNNFCKMNVKVLQLWSRVLSSVPKSRLRVLAPAGEARRWMTEVMQSLGIGADRVDFVSRQPRAGYVAELTRIDICLDTLPYSGHTTTLDAIWMGVPVISRVGRTAAGRAGASVLHHLDLNELAAGDDDQFVTAAVELSGDARRLAELRRVLRQRMQSSPLTDARRFAQNVEAAYRRIWQEWCRA